MDFIARKIDGEIYVSLDQVNKAIEEKKRRNREHQGRTLRRNGGCGYACERRLKRALWLARSEKAKTIAKIYSKEAELILLREHYPNGCGFCHIMNNKWRKVEQLCMAKAEKYK